MKKSRKKMTKKDLKDISLDRVIKDMGIVNGLVDKISTFKFGEDMEESEAEKVKTELKEVELYLKGQYGQYLDSDMDLDNINDIDDINLD